MSPTIRISMKSLSLLRDEANNLEIPISTMADLVIQEYFGELEEVEEEEDEDEEEYEEEE
jgi:hypothetical protein